MSVLVVADQANGSILPATRNVLAAASTIGGDIDVLVAGEGCADGAAIAAGYEGVNKVLLAEHSCYAHQIAENMAVLIAAIGGRYSHIMAAHSTLGKDYMPRVAALLDVYQISDIVAVESENTFKRPIYAGNAIATLRSDDAIKVVTVRGTAFDPVGETGGSGNVEVLDEVHDLELASFVSEAIVERDRPELTAARVIVSGGRGMQSGENFKLLEVLADKLDAAIGASRAAVDAGFVSNDMQVGQTGKIVAPELYIAIGISGAIQHLAGMKDSKVIVAINKDEDAPIFQIADYGLVADLFDAVPELSDKL